MGLQSLLSDSRFLVFTLSQIITLVVLLWRMGTSIKVLESLVGNICTNHIPHLQEQIDRLLERMLDLKNAGKK